jgi:hypothetical protein
MTRISPPEEKRRCPRAQIRLPVVLDTPQQLLTGETINIGADGVFISCKDPLKEKQIFNLAMIDVPLLNCRLVATAKVIWSNVHPHTVGFLPMGMGVQFIRISEKDRKYLSVAVSEYLRIENQELL